MKKFLSIVALFIIASSSLYSQNVLAPNVRHYLNSLKHRTTRHSTADATLRAYLLVDSAFQRSALAELGIHVNVDLVDMLTTDVPLHSIEQLSILPGVKYVQLAEPVKPQMDKVRLATGAESLHQGEGLSGSFTGKGVVIGVIDAGFDYTHPNFYTSDGKALRIQRVWEQDYAKGTPPDGFRYGAEFSTSEAILKASGDMPTNSHGTHVTGIAAGAYSGNDWYGVAPDAELVLVSMSSDSAYTADNVNVSDAIAYIFNYADSVNKPCVINMSLGSQIGPHDGTSFFDQMANRLQGKGRLLVGSVGNFGKEKIHVSRTFASAQDEPLKTFVDFTEKPDAKSADAKIDIWGEVGMDYDVQLVVYNYKNGQIAQTSEKISAVNSNSYVFELTSNSKGSIAVTTELNPLNNKPHALLNLSVKSLRNGYAVGLIISPRSSGTVHAWADNTHVKFTHHQVDGWNDGDTQHTLGEIGGTAEGILSVGAYTTRNTYTELNSATEKTTGEILEQISSFSATGPTVDGRMKPDIAAPGSFIISSMSSHYAALSSHPLTGYVSWNESSYPYGYMQGTSMAAPVVTGIMATWLQACPDLSISDVRDVLKNTARTDEYVIQTSNVADVWGYGKVDALKGIQHILSSTGIEKVNSADAYKIEFSGNNLKLKVCEPSVSSMFVNIYTMNGVLAHSKALHSLQQGEECFISLAHLPKGVYAAQIVCGKVHSVYKLIIH